MNHRGSAPHLEVHERIVTWRCAGMASLIASEGRSGHVGQQVRFIAWRKAMRRVATGTMSSTAVSHHIPDRPAFLMAKGKLDAQFAGSVAAYRQLC